MVAPDKCRQALQSLQRILILARFMGYEGCDPRKIADVLDAAEILPAYLASPCDKTSEFRDTVESLALRDPRFGYALAAFDEPFAVRTWREVEEGVHIQKTVIHVLVSAPQPGLSKVGLTRCLQEVLAIGLREAKEVTDSVLLGKAVAIPVRDRAMAERL